MSAQRECRLREGVIVENHVDRRDVAVRGDWPVGRVADTPSTSSTAALTAATSSSFTAVVALDQERGRIEKSGGELLLEELEPVDRLDGLLEEVGRGVGHLVRQEPERAADEKKHRYCQRGAGTLQNAVAELPPDAFPALVLVGGV